MLGISLSSSSIQYCVPPSTATPNLSLQCRPNGVVVVLAEDLQPTAVARHNGVAAIAARAHVRTVELQSIEAHHRIDDQVLLLWQQPAHTDSSQSSLHTFGGRAGNCVMWAL